MDANKGGFWVATFGGDAGVRFISDSGVNETYIEPTDYELFVRSEDAGAGVTDANNEGDGFLFAMSLNPKAVTVNGVSYGAGELGF